MGGRGRLRAPLPRAGAAAGAGKKRLTARAEWHFGGGPRYCEGCRRLGRPCARGGAGADGRRCPYVEHQPQTVEGWQAWDVLERCAAQLRVAPGGVIGLDLVAALMVGEALGYDRPALAELLPAAEAGLVKALNERMERG